MRQFKFKEWVFKNLFPYYYQENDTYRDSSGKGILQRFIEVCSQYFDDDIISDDGTQPGLDNIVNLIDVDLTPELFLNYLWEFLGEIPYAYGLIIQGKEYNKDNLRDWLFNNTDFPQADPRKLLKYAISLYKIRGTDKFYQVIGHFYGFEIELVETFDGGSVGDDNLVPSHDHLVLAAYDDTVLADLSGVNIPGYIKSDHTISQYAFWRYGLIPVPAGATTISFNSLGIYQYYSSVCSYFIDENGNQVGSNLMGPSYLSNTLKVVNIPTGAVGLQFTGVASEMGDWESRGLIYFTRSSDFFIATYSLSSDEVRAPYPDGDCYSCLYFLVKVGISQERYNQLISQGRLAIVMKLLLGIIEKYLPIHCKIAHYDNGNPKVVVYPGYDFTQDFNEDFAIENEE